VRFGGVVHLGHLYDKKLRSYKNLISAVYEDIPALKRRGLYFALRTQCLYTFLSWWETHSHGSISDYDVIGAESFSQLSLYNESIP